MTCLLKPAPAHYAQRRALQVHQPKTVERLFEQKLHFLKQSSAHILTLNNFLNVFSNTARCLVLSLVLLNTQVAFLESCCLFAISLQTHLSTHRASVTFSGQAFTFTALKCNLKIHVCSRLAAGSSQKNRNFILIQLLHYYNCFGRT